jgi:hypothetical protein
MQGAYLVIEVATVNAAGRRSFQNPLEIAVLIHVAFDQQEVV